MCVGNGVHNFTSSVNLVGFRIPQAKGQLFLFNINQQKALFKLMF